MNIRAYRKSERISVLIIWVLALLGTVFIGVFTALERQLAWVSIAMLMLVFVAAVVQLLMTRPKGFIHRMSLSLTGAAVILGLGSVIFLMMGAHGFVFVEPASGFL